MFSADQIHLDAQRFVFDAARSAQYAELADIPVSVIYKSKKAEIGRAILALKRAHAALCQLENHVHKWDPETDYCQICGADGRA